MPVGEAKALGRKGGAMTCCDKWREATGQILSVSPAAFGYPKQSDSQIEQCGDGTWNVNGCCGGNCYVIHDLMFCPWCAAALDQTPPSGGKAG